MRGPTRSSGSSSRSTCCRRVSRRSRGSLGPAPLLSSLQNLYQVVANDRWLACPTFRDDPTKTANQRVVAGDEVTSSLLVSLRLGYAPCGSWNLAIAARPVGRDDCPPGGVGPRRWRRGPDAAAPRFTSLVGDDVDRQWARLPHSRQSTRSGDSFDDLCPNAHAMDPVDARVTRTLGRILDLGAQVGRQVDSAPGDEFIDGLRRNEDSPSRSHHGQEFGGD